MSDLLDTIDAAAASLLDAAGFSAKVEGVEPPKVELTDRVKAFQAVVDWAKTRNVLRPGGQERRSGGGKLLSRLVSRTQRAEASVYRRIGSG